jgi:ParB-like chromosome segregation protein Spo0J
MVTDGMAYIAEGLRPLAVPVDSLTEDPRNARTHSRRNLEAIRASLERYGQVKPLAVRRDGMVVLAGNGRLRVAREMGWTHVAAVLMDGTEEELAAFAIADNRTSELASWDDAALADIVSGLAEGGEVDLSGLGFDAAELAALADSEEASVPEAVDHGQEPERQADAGPAGPPAVRGGAGGQRHRDAGRAAVGAAHEPADGRGAQEALALAPEQAAVLAEAAAALREEKGRPDMALGEVVRILARRYLRRLGRG